MDTATLNLGSLNLNDLPSAKIKVDELFLEWLNLNETGRIIDFLLEEASTRTAEGSPPGSSGGDNSTLVSDSTILNNNSAPPRSPTNRSSPKKRTQSEMLNAAFENGSRKVGPGEHLSDAVSQLNFESNRGGGSGEAMQLQDSTGRDDQQQEQQQIDRQGRNDDEQDRAAVASSSRRQRSSVDSLPVFFVPQRGHRSRKPLPEDELITKLTEIESYFKAYPSGIPFENFVHITKGLCGLPSFFNLPLCRRISSLFPVAASSVLDKSQPLGPNSSAPAATKVTLKVFLQFWQKEIEPFDRFERFFRLVKQPNVNYICKDDFVPFVQELLHFHPGLEFLESHDEFQRKYALTVIARIFFKVNVSRTGKLSLREVYNSNLIHEFMHVDEETDINRVVEYFSYEHFYVLYCRFFELDADKDSKLTRDDLLKYGEHSLSEAVVDRIFQVGCRAFTDGKEGGFRHSGMTYSDFIYFMLAEEDKSSLPALTYWYRCADLDADGVLTPDELSYFYRSQLHRITSMGQESVFFGDVLCQMLDMISPEDPLAITFHDLARKKAVSGVLFDVLFNLHKFMRFETRDPFQEKQKRDDMFSCDWDRFAHIEYHRLAAEEEGFDHDSSNMDLGQDQGGHAGNEWLIDDEDDEDDGAMYVASGKGGGGGGSSEKGSSKGFR